MCGFMCAFGWGGEWVGGSCVRECGVCQFIDIHTFFILKSKYQYILICLYPKLIRIHTYAHKFMQLNWDAYIFPS